MWSLPFNFPAPLLFLHYIYYFILHSMYSSTVLEEADILSLWQNKTLKLENILWHHPLCWLNTCMRSNSTRGSMSSIVAMSLVNLFMIRPGRGQTRKLVNDHISTCTTTLPTCDISITQNYKLRKSPVFMVLSTAMGARSTALSICSCSLLDTVSNVCTNGRPLKNPKASTLSDVATKM